ncbi:uncharacterized protein A4U43_C02F8630 [Asparagus officinalis]|uniref:Uncharacterized protein n=1 Tax=Asparagus officinalis TaxID=4686 RepID=A0A5P1FKZ4_ASPOF|nr:uncharacterized protein LOC109830438 [Asparagus officinalis]ONK77619.1 uncharacterized protein A4U43_C02F8630 [Asparagus officinalis]
MRTDFASCFSDHAVKVSDSSCTRPSVIPAAAVVNFSVQTAVTSVYRSILSSKRNHLIKVTWSKTELGPTLSMAVDDSINPQLLKKTKGTRSLVLGSSIISVHWDYSMAKFNNLGPDPISDFYIIVIVDTEVALMLGDMSRDYIKTFQNSIQIAQFLLVSRLEKIIGHNIYSTKAQFSEEGKEHDIVISCNGDLEMTVSIDNKRVVHVRRLQWNFRGNHTIFVDGLPIDLMWDLKNFNRSKGYAVFMFRKRRSLESRLWFEEEIQNSEKGVFDFSLLIQAFKSLTK